MSSRIRPATLPLRQRGRARGTATVEAVIALPVLVLLFISVFYVRDLALARHEAKTKARTCAWTYSANNCSHVPAGCEGVLHETRMVGYSNEEVTSHRAQLSGEKVGGFVGGILDSAFDEIFGKASAAVVKREVPRPHLYGGATQVVAGDFHLACNIQQKTVDDLAKDAWSSLDPF